MDYERVNGISDVLGFHTIEADKILMASLWHLQSGNQLYIDFATART